MGARWRWLSAAWSEDYSAFHVSLRHYETGAMRDLVITGGGEFDRLLR